MSEPRWTLAAQEAYRDGIEEGRRLERNRVTEAGAPKSPGERAAYLAGERDGRRLEREAVVNTLERRADHLGAHGYQEAAAECRAQAARFRGGEHVAGEKGEG